MLDIKNITKTFNPGTTDAKKALDSLSFHAEHGDFVTIIGANGAGKSTLFNAIAGSFITDSGSIFLAGQDITLTPEHKRSRVIGRLFQDPMRGTAPGMTVEENLALAAGHGGWLSWLKSADKKLFRERVAMLGMGLEDLSLIHISLFFAVNSVFCYIRSILSLSRFFPETSLNLLSRS